MAQTPSSQTSPERALPQRAEVQRGDSAPLNPPDETEWTVMQTQEAHGEGGQAQPGMLWPCALSLCDLSENARAWLCESQPRVSVRAQQQHPRLG